MKKYLAFLQVSLKEQFAKKADVLGTILSFSIHITIFSFLWDFVLEGKNIAGYSKQELIWYVIIAEAILYSFHYYYRKIARKVEMGDFAYDMTKPYNFLIRTVVEGIAELPVTVIILVVGGILGTIYAGLLKLTFVQIIVSLIVILLANTLLLIINIIVGLLSLWLGSDVSSVWILIQKAMLIFAFTPIELFPIRIQKILILIPTTHVVYTPSSLFVHFSLEKVILSLGYILLSFVVLSFILFIIYKKGVKKQNVNGI